ncbi:tRNA-specific adenosine deaminase 1 [Haplosporangium gracile]|nr:tRNA-specific adenosine deaminase 1 [Haplosporangium gracile]
MRTSRLGELTDNIVQECHAQFDKLPKHGKPAKRSNGQAEWTILAGILMTTPIKDQRTISTSPTKTSDKSSQTAVVWEIECISLATGSKCLPQGKQSSRGDLLNDCHAEVLARRGFNRWCLQEMRRSIEEPHNIKNKFKYLGDRSHGDMQLEKSPLFELANTESQFHLYVSQAPCGDATTASLALTQSEESKNAFMVGQQTRLNPTVQNPTISGDQDLSISPVIGSKRERETEPVVESPETGSPFTKLQKRDTTASITNSHTATAASGLRKGQLEQNCNHILGFRRGRIDYNSVGVLRTKPGRVDSEPTLSMSCSDKIARWSILGLNSALVMPFLKKPIYLESIVTRELFDAEALERALFGRIQDCRRCMDHITDPHTEEASAAFKSLHPHRIGVHKSEIAFEFSKEAVLKQSEQEGVAFPPVASPSTSEPRLTEVLVNGCKAGASAKKQIQSKSRSRLCKINMFESSVALWKSTSPQPLLVQSMMSKTETSSLSESGPADITYHKWKRLDKDFMEAKEQLFTGVFQNWVRGDSLLESFNIHGDTLSESSN